MQKIQRRKFLSCIGGILPIAICGELPSYESSSQTIKLIKDQNSILDLIGGVYSINIYGRDGNDVFWHWKLLYHVKNESETIQICEPYEIKQILPVLKQNQEIARLSYSFNYEYKTEYLSGPPKKLTVEEIQVKSSIISVDISYKKHEITIKKRKTS